MTAPFKDTDEGFLQGRAIVTSVGVFTYRNADGTTSRELRLPEEVFNKDSLASMKGKPVANDHPKERITAENAKVYQVGSLGSNPSDWVDSYAALHGEAIPERGMSGSDGFHLSIDMTITDKDAIADVKAGKTALSMGYTCDIEPAQPGATWCGMSYDGIQRKIRYNHCAIVDVARAGDAARIRMDSADAIQILNTGVSPKPNQEGNSMKKYRMDNGIEYEGDEGLIQAYLDAKSRADSAETKLAGAEKTGKDALSKMEGERDSHKDRADKLEAEVKEFKANALDSKRLDEAVKARVELMDAAIRAGVEVKDGVSDAELRKSIIAKVYPEAKMDGRDDAYIQGRFDSALEELRKDADDTSRPVISDSVPAGDRNDSTAAYKRMIEFQKAQSRGQKAEG
jgi:hypothetical protein